MRIFLLLFSFLLFLQPLLALDLNDPPPGVFLDEWYAVMISGKKSGHMHATMERKTRSGQQVIHTHSETVMEVRRLGDGAVLKTVQDTDETLAGEPLAFSNQMYLGLMPNPSITRGRIEDGQVRLTSSQFGQSAQTKTYPFPEGGKMAWAVHRESIRRGFEPGTKYELRLYEPTLAPDRVTMAAVEILKRETIDLFGRKVDTVRSKQSLKLKNMLRQETEVETVNWITPEGRVLRSRLSVMNIPIEVVGCTKPVALSPNDPAELMVQTLISADKPINARKAREVVYRLSFAGGDGNTDLSSVPETAMQKIKPAKPGNGVIVTVTRQTLKEEAVADQPLTDQERKRYLEAAPMVNHKDSTVAKLAKQASGTEKAPARLTRRLCRFVGAYIKSSALNVGFASAGEVARSQEGDCSEYGVLLAALGRAVGIPTRIVTGVVYAPRFGDRQDVFVGHLWTQFWVNGRWIDLDATRGQVGVDATHIALSIGDAGDSGIADIVNSIWLNLGNLRINVLDSR